MPVEGQSTATIARDATYGVGESQWVESIRRTRPEARTEKQRVLVVGAGARGQDIAKELMARPGNGQELVGFVDDRADLPCPDGLSVLGRFDQVLEVAEAHQISEVILAYTPNWHEELLKRSMERGNGSALKIKVLPGIYDALVGNCQIERVDDIPLVKLTGTDPSPFFEAMKRTFDIAFSIVMLMAAVPVVALAALAMKVTSRGPAIYLQERLGKDGRPFRIVKLRTMIVGAERETGPTLARKSDDRVTRVGRFLRRTHIDEIPQFWNVLRGEMSVIGPRPERPHFAREYAEKIPGYTERLKVDPGITGLAQVYGDYLTSVYHKVRYDWMYIHRRSFWQEAHILLLTVRAVLCCAGT